MSRKVIVNVDDLGLSEPVNNAVATLARKRLITASSYMVGGSISNTCIKQLQLFNVDIGLHLDFTGIYKTALPKSLSKLLQANYMRRLDASTVTDEIKQQLDMFEDTFNHSPRFIDGHQHVHQFPIIRQCLISELLKRYANKPTCHSPFNRLTHIAARVTTPINYDPKAWIIYALGGHKWKKLCEQSGIATNNHFGGVYNFQADLATLNKLWDVWLSLCPLGIGGFNDQIKDNPVTVIMCHPAIADDNWQDAIKQAREREFEWMMSGALKTLYDKHFVELTHWKDIIHR